MKHSLTLAILLSVPLTACTADDADVDTTATGAARYRDASTNHDGESVPAARPDGQTLQVEIAVEGQGELSGLDPQCTIDGLSGGFEGLFSGDADVGPDGVYVAGLASGEATFLSPSGCQIPDLEITTIGDVVVRGSLEATTANCESYCEAKARSHGETSCGAEPSAASCRTAAEADYRASCTASCTSRGHTIVAESRLSAEALAEMNARTLTGTALGELHVDLTFDQIEDADGDPVAENP